MFDGATGNSIPDFFAYDAGFSGGVNVAAGDLDGDGNAEIVTGAGAGGPAVKAFGGGVRVGVADTDGDGKVEVFATSSTGLFGVKRFNSLGQPVSEFAGFTGGAFVG